MKADASNSRAMVLGRRLVALRGRMAALGLGAYLVPSADEHQNEYLPPYKRRREAITGFAGSAGDAIICMEEAHLWVDSRYHLEADQAVDPSLVQIHKLGQAGVLDWLGWLRARESASGPLSLGYDPRVISLRMAERVRESLKHPDSKIVPVDENLVDAVWDGRPSAPAAPVYGLADAITGETVGQKLERIRAELESRAAGMLVLSRLDEVAWVTNLRGSDIPYNPVFEGYLAIESDRATCFTDRPVPPKERATLAKQIEFRPLGEFPSGIGEAMARLKTAGTAVWADRDGTSEGVQRLLVGATVIQDTPNPVVRFKAIKNPVEVELSREGHLKSGTAKIRSFSILNSWMAEGRGVSEKDYADLLETEYAKEEGFSDLSFNTIAAHGANGAIVHYGSPDPHALLAKGNLLLVDSGIQVLGATTDDTRTIGLGQPTAEQRRRYTDVLRGHIRLALQVFPEGTTGQMLDALARSPLWNEGADYGHGTGHGVGAFLNVHEGPHSISSRGAVALEPGMIVSNEPGYYRAGWGGIRLENLYVVEEAMGMAPHPGGRRWLRMSPLTWIPFDLTLVEAGRLASEEQGWLKEYHGRVWDLLSPRVGEPHRHWLQRACGLAG